MAELMEKNREIYLASRPEGMPEKSNFKLEIKSLPKLKEGEVLIKTLYLSVDPYMRGRMNDRPSYIAPFEINKPLTGSIVGKVVESKSSSFKPNDFVAGFLNWSDYSIAPANLLQKLDPTIKPISYALGVLGMPGMTAYFGLLEIGKPKKGETVVVSGAAGAVGTVVGQIAKIMGCRVIGIAGSDEKVEYLIKELGFDAAVNYKHKNYAQELKKACPKGVDVYFDNVGGDITDQVLQLINQHARVVICGQISMYNAEKTDVGPRNWWILLTKSASAKGFIVSEYTHQFPKALKEVAEWIKQGRIYFHETVVDGLENAPEAFLGLFHGENIGKQIVKVSDN